MVYLGQDRDPPEDDFYQFVVVLHRALKMVVDWLKTWIDKHKPTE